MVPVRLPVRVIVIAATCDSSSVYVAELNWTDTTGGVPVAVAVAVAVEVAVAVGDAVGVFVGEPVGHGPASSSTLLVVVLAVSKPSATSTRPSGSVPCACPALEPIIAGPALNVPLLMVKM